MKEELFRLTSSSPRLNLTVFSAILAKIESMIAKCSNLVREHEVFAGWVFNESNTTPNFGQDSLRRQFIETTMSPTSKWLG